MLEGEYFQSLIPSACAKREMIQVKMTIKKTIQLVNVIVVLAVAALFGDAQAQDYAVLSEAQAIDFSFNQTWNNHHEQTVYVCTGNYAYAFHSHSNCPGLSNCRGQIQYASASYAIYTMGRRPCCRCWSDVSSDDCQDDNPYYGGGGGAGDDELYAYIALAVIVTGAIILSNDVYLHPVFSLEKTESFYGEDYRGVGWAVGFRKTFDQAALEYGASFIKPTSSEYLRSFFDFESDMRVGGHLNLIQYFQRRRKYAVWQPFVGMSANFVDGDGGGFGFGGMMGIQRQLTERLSFDFRYELTSFTNQLQVGLFYRYQDEYFWQR